MQKNQPKRVSPIEALTKGSYGSFDFNGQLTVVKNNIAKNGNASAINDTIDQKSSGKFKRQGMRLGYYNLMVKFEDGNKISDIPSIYPLPNSPSWFLGMSNVDGKTIPVFNLKKYFNIDETPHTFTKNTKQMLFIIQQGENATGIIIDGLLERLTVDEKSNQSDISIPDKLKVCVNDAYLLEQDIWYDLNCLDFLDEIEKQIAS